MAPTACVDCRKAFRNILKGALDVISVKRNTIAKGICNYAERRAEIQLGEDEAWVLEGNVIESYALYRQVISVRMGNI